MGFPCKIPMDKEPDRVYNQIDSIEAEISFDHLISMQNKSKLIKDFVIKNMETQQYSKHMMCTFPIPHTSPIIHTALTLYTCIAHKNSSLWLSATHQNRCFWNIVDDVPVGIPKFVDKCIATLPESSCDTCNRLRKMM